LERGGCGSFWILLPAGRGINWRRKKGGTEAAEEATNGRVKKVQRAEGKKGHPHRRRKNKVMGQKKRGGTRWLKKKHPMEILLRNFDCYENGGNPRKTDY